MFDQFPALEHMYSNMMLSKKDTTQGKDSRLYRLVQQFTGFATPLLQLKLLFIQNAASKFNVAIKILEKEEPLIHVQPEILGKLLHDHMSIFLKQSALVAAESYKDLVEVQYKEQCNQLAPKHVVLPVPVKRHMEKMGISEENHALINQLLVSLTSLKTVVHFYFS